MKRLAGTIVVMLALLGAESAPAAVEVGGHCEGNTLLIAGIEEIVFPLSAKAPAVPPVSSPVSGIATSWSVRSGSTNTFSQRLKVLRTTPGADAVQVVGEAPPQPVSKGSGSFPIRIPVQAGDRFGLSGVGGGVVACNTGAPEDVVGATSRNGQPGQSESFSRLSGYQLPLTVTVEPDSDNDGFGDETQDRCVGTASAGSDCPIAVRINRAAVKRRGILVEITPEAEALVKVRGEFRWRGGGSKARVVAAVRDTRERQVNPGRIAAFAVPLPRPVQRRLARMRPGNSMVARIEIYITDRDGWRSSKSKRVVMRGRALGGGYQP